jgi:cell division protein FtsL
MTTTTPAITLYVRQDGSVIPAVVSTAPPLPANAGAPGHKGH